MTDVLFLQDTFSHSQSMQEEVRMQCKNRSQNRNDPEKKNEKKQHKALLEVCVQMQCQMEQGCLSRASNHVARHVMGEAGETKVYWLPLRCAFSREETPSWRKMITCDLEDGRTPLLR